MKSSPLPWFIIVCSWILCPAVLLAAQDLPPPQNTEALLRELDKIDSGSQSLSQKRRAEAISRIQSASSSGPTAVELYVTALDNTKYLENHPAFIEWKQKKQDDLHHSSFQNAAQLQLRYILLGLQRSEQKTALAQVPETLAYLNSLSSLHFLEGTYNAAASAKGAKTAPTTPIPSDKITSDAAALIKQPIAGSPVVDWLQIADLFPEGKDFEASAGNYEGILDKNVKTPLRTTNDPRLPEVWDLQISTESAVTSAANSKQKTETFTNDRLPDLLFRKAQDTAAIGQPNRALNEVMMLVRNYPANSSMQDWITTARGLLTNPPVASPVASTAISTATNAAIAPTSTPTNSSAPGTPVFPANAH